MIFYIIQILPTFPIHSTPLGNFNNAQTLVVHGGGCKSISKFTHIHLLYSSSILPHPRGYLETCWIAHVCITQFLCSVFHTLFIHAYIWIFCALLENLNCMHFNHYRVGKEFHSISPKHQTYTQDFTFLLSMKSIAVGRRLLWKPCNIIVAVRKL